MILLAVEAQLLEKEVEYVEAREAQCAGLILPILAPMATRCWSGNSSV